jgi:hypothetical protein
LAQLDPNCGPNFVIDDGVVYFQAGSKGLYRIPCDGCKKAEQMDVRCEQLVVHAGYVYFHAGNKGLYRIPCDGKSGDAQQMDVNAVATWLYQETATSTSRPGGGGVTPSSFPPTARRMNRSARWAGSFFCGAAVTTAS